MKILIVAATLPEIKTTMDRLGLGSFTIFKEHEIDILITGVGMINTTYQLSKRLHQKKYDLAINAGIAGSFDRSIDLGEVVQVVSDYFSEIGAEDGDQFLSLIQLGFQEHDEFPYQWGELIPDVQYSKMISSINTMRTVRGITVNTVHGDCASIIKVQTRLNPQIETMEGAAFFYGCMMEQIPCIQIRSISNYVEKRNRDNWEIGLAVKNLNLQLIALIETL
jgi:futalosine hydrolase